MATCHTCGRPKAAVYARISDDQKGERLGVTDQAEDCWARAGAEDWCTCTPDADTFSDNDIGAYRVTKRPGWDSLREAIAASRYRVLLARDDGRFGRNLREYLDFVDLVERQRLQVVTLWTDRWDLSTAAGRKRVRDSASDAMYEAERTGERVARARLRDAKAGKPSPGGQRAWGFMPDRIAHNPEEAAAIRDVAQRLLAGESLRSASIRYRKQPKDVRRALLAPRMIGMRAYKGVDLYPAIWEPVLDRDTWEGVRALLLARNRDKVAGVTARRYLLSGFLFCWACGDRCQGFRRGRYLKYVCHPKGCVVRSVPRLDAHVRDQLLTRAEVSVTPATVDPALTGAVTGYEARLAEAKELWKTGALSAQEYAADKLDLEARLADARARLADATEEWELDAYWAEDPETGEPLWVLTGDEAEKRAWWEEADLRQRRVLLARYVSRIVLRPNTNRRVFEPSSVEILDRDGKPWKLVTETA